MQGSRFGGCPVRRLAGKGRCEQSLGDVRREPRWSLEEEHSGERASESKARWEGTQSRIRRPWCGQAGRPGRSVPRDQVIEPRIPTLRGMRRNCRAGGGGLQRTLLAIALRTGP